MYTIKKVSELTGIPSVTIRAWENRYHVVQPERSPGGHRLYSEQDLLKLKWLKEQIKKGKKISEVAGELEQQAISVLGDLSQGGEYQQGKEALVLDLYNNLISMNTSKANEKLDLAFSLFSYHFVFHEILAPILIKIGTEWEAGELTVGQEHFTTELVTGRFHQVMRVIPVRPGAKKALAFCPEGEHHQFGLMLFSLFLQENGYEVIFLGRDTPFQGLIEQVMTLNIELVAVSMTCPMFIQDVLNWIHSYQKDKSPVSFVLGGQAIRHFDCPKIPNVYFEKELTSKNWNSLSFLKGK